MEDVRLRWQANVGAQKSVTCFFGGVIQAGYAIYFVFCCRFKKISSFIEFDEIFDSENADFKQWGVTWHLLEVA
jgi:hypothetical protein